MADHKADARDLLSRAETAPSDDPENAQVLALAGIGHALLDVADAIREQTTTLVDFMGNEGVRTVEL